SGLDSNRPSVSQPERVLERRDPPANCRMQPEPERRRTCQCRGQAWRLALTRLEHDSVYPSHLASVAIDDRFVETVPDKVHISPRRFRAGSRKGSALDIPGRAPARFASVFLARSA